MFLFGLAGAALFVFLLRQYRITEIASAIAGARWAVLAIVVVHFIQLIPKTLGWRLLLPRDMRPASLFWISWIGESVTSLLPLTQVGGDFVRARLATTRGIPAPLAASTVLVDVTISAFVQVIYTLVGLVLLIYVTGDSSLTVPVLIGSLLLLAGVAGFYLVQHYGMFRLITGLIARLARGTQWQDLTQRGDAFDAEVHALYSRRRAILANSALTFICWLLSALEVWIALRALGIRAGFAEACILESVSRAVRTGMFLVPGALGLQEGGHIVVGRVLGIGAQTALALALIRRVRELAVGVPALVLWQCVEGSLLWRRGRRGTEPTAAGAVSTVSSPPPKSA